MSTDEIVEVPKEDTDSIDERTTSEQNITFPMVLTDGVLNKYQTNPLLAIQEIIWNSIDADANNIRVTFDENELKALKGISIKDDGIGFSTNNIEIDISNLSTSNKKNTLQSPGGRLYHGKRGEGFYKIAHLGNVVWKTCNGMEEIECTVKFDQQIVSSTFVQQCTDQFTEVDISFKDSLTLWKKETLNSMVLSSLISLEQYNVSMYFDGIKYDLDNLYSNHKEYSLFKKIIKEKPYNITCKIIEINKELTHSNKIIILAQDKTFLAEWTHQNKSFSNKPITIYMTFLDLPNDFTIMDLNIEDQIKEIAKEEIQKFKDSYKKDKKEEFLADIKIKKILPIQLSKEDSNMSPSEQKEKKVLEEVLFKLYEYNKIDLSQPKKEKNSKVISELLYHSLSNNSDTLLDILQEVLNLNSTELEELKEILNHTSFSNIIKLSQVVAHRLKLLNYLDILFYKGSDENKNILERRQLQKLIDQNMWLLSEDFEYYLSDKSIESWLTELNKQLGLEKYTDLNYVPSTDIPDYIIGKKKKGRANSYHHLVVEIKRPSYILNNNSIISETQEYIEQLIERAPTSIKSDWEIWFLVTSIPESIKGWIDEEKGLKQVDKHKKTPYKVYIKTWGELIQQKKSELEYLNEKLELKISTENCKEYVLKKYAYMNIIDKKTVEEITIEKIIMEAIAIAPALTKELEKKVPLLKNSKTPKTK